MDHTRHAHLHKRSVHGPRRATASPTLNIEPARVVPRSSAATCGSSGDSSCGNANLGASSPLTIGLATGIPLTVVIAILFYLHRRNKKKMRQEDIHDKYKSLDFGLDVVPVQEPKKRKNGPKGPEMTINTLHPTRSRGMSVDMDLHSPYILPGSVHESRDSLYSMQRSLNEAHDPYRPVTFISRTASRTPVDHYSSYTRYSDLPDFSGHQKAGLLPNAAQNPTRDTPESFNEKFSPFDDPVAPDTHNLPPPPPPPRSASVRRPVQHNNQWYPADDQRHGSSSPPDLSNMAPQSPQDMLSDKAALPNYPPPTKLPTPPPSVPEINVYQESAPVVNHTSRKPSAGLRITVPPPVYDRVASPRSPNPLPDLPTNDYNDSYQPETQLAGPPVPMHLSVGDHEQQDQLQKRISVMGLRPLPPDDPNDNPEQRANRIRSFYREYFDESKPNPPGQYPDPYGYGYDEDDYQYETYLEDGAVYDPETGAFYYSQPQQPYAEPIARRAMTPPPRGMPNTSVRPRSFMSTQSAARPTMGKPKKKLPPPKALTSLPTPFLLRDDTSNLTDFAPRTTFRDIQLGRGIDSPLGTPRPYNPAFKATKQLVSSFDDLAIMPSPHALRKSGNFTGLDFAPPPRFRDRGETMSETGSIRSNRSGMSALQRDAIRAGAYRLSRLPKDTVGSKDDFKISLKPQWDMKR